jgi:peptidoglycan biosynthesis protein MviN/MurJ (putative lipid II flippase)
LRWSSQPRWEWRPRRHRVRHRAGFAAEPGKFALTVELLRITSVHRFHLAGVAGGRILNTWNRFSIPALTPALLNVSFIVGAVFFAEYFEPPVKSSRGHVRRRRASARIADPVLARLGLLPRWRLDWQHPGAPHPPSHGSGAFGVSVSRCLSSSIRSSLRFSSPAACLVALLRRSTHGNSRPACSA